MRGSAISAAGFGDVYERARVACRSITGLEDDRAWLVRDAALSVAPVAALASVLGTSATRSWQLRARYLRRAPKTVMSTLHAGHRSAGLGHAQPSGR